MPEKGQTTPPEYSDGRRTTQKELQMPDNGNGFIGGLSRHIRPEVERPNAGNQVGRPLFVGLVVLFFLNAVAALGAILTAWLIGPAAGFLVVTGVLVYGLRVNCWWPLSVDWHTRALAHRRTLLYLLAFGGALLALLLLDQWPHLAAVERRWLGLVWQYEAGRVFVYTRAAATWRELRWLQWARLATIIIIPATLPRVLKLLWYRFSVGIVYPTWDDSVSAQGRRFVDPLGLIEVINTTAEPQAAPASSAAQVGGML
jgi:hypothetical protein